MYIIYSTGIYYYIVPVFISIYSITRKAHSFETLKNLHYERYNMYYNII